MHLTIMETSFPFANPSSRGAFNAKPGETRQLLSAGATWKSLFLRCNEAVCQMSRLPLFSADNLFIYLQACGTAAFLEAMLTP